MSYLLAIIPAVCGLSVSMLWFLRTARELSRKRSELSFADKQLATCNVRWTRTRDGPELQQVLEQVELSQEIYQRVAEEYNHCIAKHRLISRAFGYDPVPHPKGYDEFL